MDKKTYMIILSVILIAALVLIYLQFKYFGQQGYWYIVLGLLAIWGLSRWLMKKQN